MKLQLNFSGYQDFVSRRTERPEGRDGKPVPVAELREDTWEMAPRFEQKGKGIKIRFPGDGSASYFRPFMETGLVDYDELDELLGIPFREHHLRDVGAYKLNRFLGLDLIPETELAELELPCGKSFEKVVGSIQHWIAGVCLDVFDYSPYHEKLPGILDKNERRMLEHYVYAVVAYDMDRAPRNYSVQESDDSLWAYDVNLSGGDPASQGQYFSNDISKRIEGKTLPPELLGKLKAFIDNRSAAEAELRTYYPAQVVAQMFERAQYLLNNPVVLPLYKLRKKLV